MARAIDDAVIAQSWDFERRTAESALIDKA
jgi:hypothetical protein